MHPAVSHLSENSLIVASNHDCLIGSRILPLLVAISSFVEYNPCVVDCEVVIKEETADLKSKSRSKQLTKKVNESKPEVLRRTMKK